MHDFGVGVLWFYIGGCLLAMLVYRFRAGLGLLGRPRLDLTSIRWGLVTVLKIFGWPIVFPLWLMNERPAPRIVFER